ncbi:hydrophobic surface binding protein A-domain-containing protein [Bombardia bombarda]|uniref:Hydrophobic surface binding protein A-domain-containing protein n=1 Tax=Bombardia bombarda TaxID=252184 RepID=A0AA39XNT7_9PEZI|nr:hydrophobic surface binding protein A-domain-containing protein [Bombardia bombarda]
MKLTTLLTPLSLLALQASTVLADGASIVNALDTVNNSTLKLNSLVSSWNGKLLGTLPIVAESTALLAHIMKGTKTAKDSAALAALDALGVAGSTITLSASVNTTLTTIIAAKRKFDKRSLSPVILLNLELEKSATEDFSAAIIAKLPADLQGLAQNLVAPIDASFEQGIDKYKLL